MYSSSTLSLELLCCRCSRSLLFFSCWFSSSCRARWDLFCSCRSSYSRFRTGTELRPSETHSRPTPDRPSEHTSWRETSHSCTGTANYWWKPFKLINTKEFEAYCTRPAVWVIVCILWSILSKSPLTRFLYRWFDTKALLNEWKVFHGDPRTCSSLRKPISVIHPNFTDVFNCTCVHFIQTIPQTSGWFSPNHWHMAVKIWIIKL